MRTRRRWGWRAATVLGLLATAAGNGILMVAGVEFPVAIPPGGEANPASARSELVFLLLAALIVLLLRWRWTPALGALLAAMFAAGFWLDPTGLANLTGQAGALAAAGQAVQQLGALTAVLAGLVATAAGYRGARTALRSSGDTRTCTPSR
ncbi:hypothetical protein [Allonocardiopsis opalescens]|nr:hypothetical protein [Allonocardiopsis opalescens]